MSLIDDGDNINLHIDDSDSDSDIDSFEIQNSEEDQPILTAKQQKEILELKP